MEGKTLYYCDHQYGSGKTTAWLRHCAERSRLINQCVVYPTLNLLNQKLRQFRELVSRDVEVRAITSECSKRVINDLLEHLNGSGTARRRVLFITYQAWLELPHIHHAEEWEFCFDDCATTPFVDLSRKLADQHHLLTDLLEPVDPRAEFSLLRVRDGKAGRLERVAVNEDGDEALDVISKVTRAMMRPEAWVGVWCRVDNWLKVAAGADAARTDGERDERRKLFLQGEINPERFTRAARTTFLRTRWTGTLMCLNASRNHAIRFMPHPHIHPAGIPYRGQGLNILHYQKPIFSKHNRDQEVADGPTRFEQFKRRVEAVHAGKPYGVVMNNDKRSAGVTFSGAETIPPECAGQEDFAELTSIAAPIALRYSACMMAFLQHRGIRQAEANDDLYAEGIAQIIMRSAARRQGFNGEVTAHVMDEWVAHRLLDRFPLATTQHVPGVLTLVTRAKRPNASRPGRRRKHASGAERTRACRARKRAAALAAQGARTAT